MDGTQHIKGQRNEMHFRDNKMKYKSLTPKDSPMAFSGIKAPSKKGVIKVNVEE